MERWTARGLGIFCGLAAISLGFVYLLAAGAPSFMLAIQMGAVAIGLVSLPILATLSRVSPRDGSGIVLLLLGIALLLTALFGLEASGATRWIRLGAVNLQTSLVLVPVMLMLYARRPGPLGTVGVVLAASALALQPDRAMAAVMAVALILLASLRRNRLTIGTALCAAAAFAATLARPDALPAVPFVDAILYSAFDVHVLVGVAVLAGSALLLLPPFGAGEPQLRLVFGAVWLSILAAAALGNYPTPLVGYGGSAILGYWLSVALLPGRKAKGGAHIGRSPLPADPPPLDPLLRAAA